MGFLCLILYDPHNVTVHDQLSKEPDMQNLESWLAERDAALTALDMDYARSMARPNTPDDILLIGMHKARYECRSIARELRLISAEWLRERGFQGGYGPLLPVGELP